MKQLQQYLQSIITRANTLRTLVKTENAGYSRRFPVELKRHLCKQ